MDHDALTWSSCYLHSVRDLEKSVSQCRKVTHRVLIQFLVFNISTRFAIADMCIAKWLYRLYYLKYQSWVKTMNIFYTKKRFTSYPRAENFKKLSRIKVRCEFKKKKKTKVCNSLTFSMMKLAVVSPLQLRQCLNSTLNIN